MKTFIDFLTDYIDQADPNLVKKGKSLYQKSIDDNWESDTNEVSIQVFVPDTKDEKTYEVNLGVEKSMAEIFCECSKFTPKTPCRHGMAAIFWCIDNPDVLPVLQVETPPPSIRTQGSAARKNKMDFTFVRIPNKLELKYLGTLATGKKSGRPSPIKLVSDKGPTLQFSLALSKSEFLKIAIEFDLKTGYRTGCSCGNNDNANRFCEHIFTAFQYVYQHLKPDFFLKYRDFTDEQNEVLKPYHLTVHDPEAQHLKWGLGYNGELVLLENPFPDSPKGNQGTLALSNKSIPLDIPPRPLPAPTDSTPSLDYKIALLFNFTNATHIGFELNVLSVMDYHGKPLYKKMPIGEGGHGHLIKPLGKELVDLTTSLCDKGLFDWLNEMGRSYFIGYFNPWQNVAPSDMKWVRKRHYQLFQKYWGLLVESQPVLALFKGKINNENIQTVKLGKSFVNISFTVEIDQKSVYIKLAPSVDGEDWSTRDVSLLGGIFFYTDNTLYLPAQPEDVVVLEKYNKGFLKFPKANIVEVFQTEVSPLMKKHPVTLPEFVRLPPDVDPIPQLHLSELNEQSLMLYPKYLYDNHLLESAGNMTEFMPDEEYGVKIIDRKLEQEKRFFEFVRQLHPNFAQQRNNPYFHLPFLEVMRNRWFIKALQALQEGDYPVLGLHDLKRFRYNTHKPTWEMKAGSGTDWFDLTIAISWGDMNVPLKDIRKAIANRQDTIMLDDGTLGVLPEEWIKQYGLMLKMGEEKKGTLRISKRHFAILDELGGQIANKDILAEIKGNKDKLALLDTLQTKGLSKEIKATLRPYQLSGLNWMQTLDELGWGGCLADDMGLGKTLQTISFIQFLKEKHPGSTHLVVCPTSLLYNWQSEFDKFCPTIKYHVYYGLQRTLEDEHFESYDVILTSYGLMRNDVETLAQFPWHYVILDESQSIKNPDAATTKAVALLPYKNRLILSGTPVQNNTFDLYAQFNFINPGLLGSRDFFRNEFANPLDKKGDPEKAQQLRKMIYPFLMRRTKEQVAPDLPDKTETILWCEMGREQRGVYESYRKHYRDAILHKIDDVGMNKAGMYVLQGLLHLRQICDHPQLLKDEKEVVNESVKTEELLREVEENTGQHKILIFSQFVEMLHILKAELGKKNISFAYLDGSTSANERRNEVDRFQNDEGVKVFLISLKAGGVGLNLTAADYVYIVDPWWNPAAEQQAIDRAHRIGQKRKIFAYKMICKDTVEEKIMKLQEKKKNLADELVSEDAGFVKKLTRSDIDFLLS